MRESKKILGIDEINKIYSNLKKYSLIDEESKQAHIDKIKEKKDS